jgi:iron complex outermembrane receptor protein
MIRYPGMCSRPTVWLLLAGIAVPGFLGAQESSDANAPEDKVSKLEEIIVTGTRIRRRDFTSPSPLVTISREDLEFSGQPTLEEYLNKLPQMQPVTGRSLNNGSDGTAVLNLRGMGPGRTLVLLNGRRVAPSGTGSAVDVNNLPSALIERAEIITGGASTVYGSDAIAGVVNFITRDDFSGLSVEGGYNATAEGDADIWDANLAYGLDLQGGGNITFYVGRYEREELFADQREISTQFLIDNGEQGELMPGGSFFIPGGLVFFPSVDLGDGEINVTWDPDGTPRAFAFPDDLWNFQPFNYLQTPLSRDTIGVLGRVPVSASWEAYFEGGYARNEAASTLAPAFYGEFVIVNPDNPVLTPETQALFSREEFAVEPGLAGMFLAERLVELGPRIIEHDLEYVRAVAGLRGAFGDGWELDAWITYADAEESEGYFNTGSISRIQQGLLVDPATGQCFDSSGGCVPTDLFGEGNLSADAQDFIRVKNVESRTSRTQWLASAVLAGSPFDIRGRPVDMAFGAEWRSDEAHYQADELFFTGDAIGLNPEASIDGTESVYELYSEAIFTLFEGHSSDQRLELEVGGRWSNYDNADTVETWKAGLNWQHTGSLRFRTMFQHAVRAPNNAELFTEQFSVINQDFLGNNVDPCSASQDPVGNGNVEKCIVQGLPEDQIGVFEAAPGYPTEFILGGNPDLQPEASDTFTVGFVYSPAWVSGLTFAVDYYDLEVEDAIGEVAPGNICFDPNNREGVFCEKLERDSSGNVFRITSLIENRGLLATDGIDFQVQYVTDLPTSLALMDGSAQLTIGAALTHVFSLEYQENIVTEVFDCNGLFGAPCNNLFGIGTGTYPENKLNVNLNYGSGGLSGNLAWRWIDGTDNAAVLAPEFIYGFPDPVIAVPDVSSWSYLDLGLAYEWDNGLLLRLGINNLTDKDPPLMGNAQNGNNTDALLYDVYGRTYYLNLRYRFGSWGSE